VKIKVLGEKKQARHAWRRAEQRRLPRRKQMLVRQGRARGATPYCEAYFPQGKKKRLALGLKDKPYFFVGN
jgi:hypothetical protein